jgi:putative membrane protein
MLDPVSEPDPSDAGGDDRRTSLAGERTSMAGERTLLAWWRTGLTAIAVALGVGRLLPELTKHQTHWPYVTLGIGFSLYGIGLFVLGTWRMGVFDREARGSSVHTTEDRLLLAFLGAGVILGLGTLALILAQ